MHFLKKIISQGEGTSIPDWRVLDLSLVHRICFTVHSQFYDSFRMLGNAFSFSHFERYYMRDAIIYPELYICYYVLGPTSQIRNKPT